MSRTSISRIDPFGDAVDRAGMDAADAGGRDRIGAAAGAGGCFDGQNRLGGCAQGVAPAGHQDSAGVSAFAVQGDTQRRRRGDGRDDADGNAGPFEQGALFDMQLDEGGKISRGQPDVGQLTLKSGGPADVVERASLGVSAAPSSTSAVKLPARARLPRQPMPNRVGSSLGEDQELDRPRRAGSPRFATCGSPPVRRVRRPCRRTAPSGGSHRYASPVPTGASSGRSPSQRANVLPIGSSRTDKPDSRHKLLIKARAARSASVYRTRVTAGREHRSWPRARRARR